MKKGWVTKRLGDVCEVVNGGTPKTGVAEYWGGEHRWITPAEMGWRSSPYADDTTRKLTDRGLQTSSARLLPPYSVILSSRAPIGHLVINTKPMSTNQGCKGLIPSSAIEHKFLYYYVSSIVEELESLGTGATFKELSGAKLKCVLVPVPPLAEQHRIVAILDEAFVGLAIAQANAEKNLQYACALFASYHQKVFAQRDGSWTERTLEDVVAGDCTLSYGIVQPGDSVPDGLPVIRPTDLSGDVVVHDGLKRIDPRLAESYRRTTLKGGDLLLCVRGSTGVVSRAALDLAGANVTRGIVPIRFNPDLLADAFGLYLLRAEQVQEQIRAKTYGTALLQINIRDLRRISLAFPPLSVQQTIAATLDALAAAAQSLARTYEQKQTAVAALKSALLRQAFNGDL